MTQDTAAIPAPRSWHAHLGRRLDRTLQAMWPLVVAALLALQAALIVVHEPFADEWQALQIAVQSPGLAALFENLRYETHPPLWYLMLRALAAIVGPYNALPAAALLLGLGSQLLILLRSPLPHWARLAIALSVPVLFDFSVIARGHTLGMALILATLALWRHRRAVWPPIALLPAVDFLFGVVSLVFIAQRWREGALHRGGLAIWLAISLVSAWSVLPAADYIPVYGASEGTAFHLQMALMRFSVLYFPAQGFPHGFLWNAGLPDVLMLSLWAPLGLTIWAMSAGRSFDRAALFGLAGLMFAMSAWMYPLQYRHLFLLSLMMIALLWRRAAEGEGIPQIAAIWLGLGAIAGLWSAIGAFAAPFERSRDAAQFIAQADLADEHWVAMPDMAGQNVSALTGIAFENHHHGCMQHFVRWNTPPEADGVAAYLGWLRAAAQARGRFYIMSKKQLPADRAWRELAAFGGGTADVPYWLYVVNETAPRTEIDLPLCVPGTRPLSETPAI